jgi:hypothetical protein
LAQNQFSEIEEKKTESNLIEYSFTMSSCFSLLPSATIHATIVKVEPTAGQLLLLLGRHLGHTPVIADGIHHDDAALAARRLARRWSDLIDGSLQLWELCWLQQ